MDNLCKTDAVAYNAKGERWKRQGDGFPSLQAKIVWTGWFQFDKVIINMRIKQDKTLIAVEN